MSALYNVFEQIQVAARSKVWVCGRSLAGIAVSHPARGRGLLSVVSVVFCRLYRVSIKSSPAYKHLLQENYVEYKHIFFSKCNLSQEVFFTTNLSNG